MPFGKLVNGCFELHERRAETLDLGGSQRLLADAPHGLALEQLPNEFNERQHEPDH
jgi:hypothetical protein